MSPARLAYRPLVTYSQAHLRLKTDRGRPTQHACIGCGEPAQEWAYMGGDPDELTERGLRYSLDQDRYEPMCHVCHTRHDRAMADGRSVDVCPRGHLWSENTGIRVKRGPRTGLRFCRACNRENVREWRIENRERVNAYAREYRAHLKAATPADLFRAGADQARRKTEIARGKDIAAELIRRIA